MCPILLIPSDHFLSPSSEERVAPAVSGSLGNIVQAVGASSYKQPRCNRATTSPQHLGIRQDTTSSRPYFLNSVYCIRQSFVKPRVGCLEVSQPFPTLSPLFRFMATS